MIRTAFICIILLLLCLPCFAETIFIDNFSDQTKISYKTTNIFISNSARVANPVATNETGYLISIPITRETNEEWKRIIITYETPISEDTPEIYIKIVDENNNLIITLNNNKKLDITTNKVKSISFKSPNEITMYDSIKLKAEFDCGFGGKTPILYSWEVTAEIGGPATAKYTNNIIIGAPSPLEINNENSYIKFYYKFKKDCEATLKIIDPNYNLVETLFENKSYSLSDDLNTTWNGKNGNDIYVMSGVYIAILKIKNNDGTEGSPNPFIFAVIR